MTFKTTLTTNRSQSRLQTNTNKRPASTNPSNPQTQKRPYSSLNKPQTPNSRNASPSFTGKRPNPINTRLASPLKARNSPHSSSTPTMSRARTAKPQTLSFHDLPAQQQSDIRDAFHFLAISDPTKIYKTDVQTVFKEVLNEQLSLSECQAIFNEVDTDGSGEIDMEEFIHLMMGTHPDDE